VDFFLIQATTSILSIPGHGQNFLFGGDTVATGTHWHGEWGMI